MQKCLWTVCAVAAILGSSLGAAPGLAKPPDLPVDLRIDFEEPDPPGSSVTFGLDLFTGKLSVSINLPWNLGLPWKAAPMGEAASGVSTAQVSRRHNAACPPRAVPQVEQAEEHVVPQWEQARALFDIAERCRKVGDLDKARTCYEETHLLVPDTRLGRRAMERLIDIDSALINGVQGTAEEQESVGDRRR